MLGSDMPEQNRQGREGEDGCAPLMARMWSTSQAPGRRSTLSGWRLPTPTSTAWSSAGASLQAHAAVQRRAALGKPAAPGLAEGAAAGVKGDATAALVVWSPLYSSSLASTMKAIKFDVERPCSSARAISSSKTAQGSETLARFVLRWRRCSRSEAMAMRDTSLVQHGGTPCAVRGVFSVPAIGSVTPCRTRDRAHQ